MTARNGRILFVYWGRRGSLSKVAVEVARSLDEQQGTGDRLSYSPTNELAEELGALDKVTRPFATFHSGRSALTGLPRMRRQLTRLLHDIEDEGFDAVVVLMSHVWTPFLGRRLRRFPVRYVVVAHDAARHPGDRTGLVHGWLLRDLAHADAIVALSEAVAARVRAERPNTPVHVVPHPLLDYAKGRKPDRKERAGPLRILFLGRIMAYKGLPMLADAVRRVQRSGHDVTLGVFGEGELGEAEAPLTESGAEIVNRWIDHDEIGPLLARHDLLVLPYVEASQSGVAAAAHGSGLPIVVTPVGGLTEQVRDGVDGLVARAVSAEAIAECLERLAADRTLLMTMSAAAADRPHEMTVSRFVEALREIALGD